MSDITKCTGEGCNLSDICYRFTAKSNEYRQAYFEYPPIKDGKCEMFWGDGSQEIMDQLKKIVNK
jgi:excinuclease UvrABC ATPase subunit